MGFINREERRKQRLVELTPGVYVEQDVLGIVRRIMERWPNLKVKYLDPDSPAAMFDTPYQIVETGKDGVERIVFGCWTLDETVIDRIAQSDSWNIDILAEIEKKNAAVKRAEEKKFEDRAEVENELVASVFASPKDTYTATHPITGKPLEFRSVPKSEG